MPLPAWRPLPAQLTAPLPEPAPPPAHCRDEHGQPAVCVLDALNWIEDWRGVLHQANADRATAAKIAAPPPSVAPPGDK